MQTKKLPRREREKLRRRQEMLVTARDLFSQKGYHSVSMHEIAEKAEFAIGTLYKFFDNKEDLYKALVLEEYNHFEDAMTRAINEPDDEVEQLRNYIRARGERFRKNLPFIRIFVAESRGASFNIKAGLNGELRQRHLTFLKKVAFIFESGIKNKRFRPIADPFRLAIAFDSVLDAYLFLWLDEPEIHPYPEDPNDILDIFIKGLLKS